MKKAQRIHGVDVTLYEKKQTGTDPMGNPVFEEIPVVVSNVLIGSPGAQDVKSLQDLTGRTCVYTLGLPKGDTHDWENRRVHFFGDDFMTFGIPTNGIEDLIPLEWNKKVMVERYE